MDLPPLFSNFSLSSSSFFRASVLVRQSRLNSFCFPVTLSTGANLATQRFFFSSQAPFFIVLHIELHIRTEKIFRISYIALVFSTVIGPKEGSCDIRQ